MDKPRFYKSTFIIYTAFDPSQHELLDLAREATDGAAFCPAETLEVVDPDTDPDFPHQFFTNTGAIQELDPDDDVAWLEPLVGGAEIFGPFADEIEASFMLDALAPSGVSDATHKIVMRPQVDAEVPVLFEVDPETNEALGMVHPFCSDRCRDQAVTQTAPTYPGAVYSPGTSHLGDFGNGDGPKCESCQILLSTITKETR